MEVLLIGAGKVGANLAEELIDAGEDVIIIEQDPEVLQNLDHLDCTKIEGMPIDIDVLESAGIRSVDAVACVSNNENMNVMAGQLIKNIYDKEKVIVKIENPANESMYQAMGLQTVCTTSMIIGAVLQNLDFVISSDITSVLGHPIKYDLRQLTEAWEGVTVNTLEHELGVHLLAVVKGNKIALVGRDYILSANESVIVVSLPEVEKAD